MKKFVNILLFFGLTLCFNVDQPYSKEKLDNTCYKRGVEIIFPYQKGIFKIKQVYTDYPDIQKKELIKFKKSFENNFFGIPLYKEAGCSNARLSEYLECLISTDGKNCRIYYTQMRIVD